MIWNILMFLAIGLFVGWFLTIAIDFVYDAYTGFDIMMSTIGAYIGGLLGLNMQGAEVVSLSAISMFLALIGSFIAVLAVKGIREMLARSVAE